MRIDSVAERPDRAGRHLVCFSDGSKMRLYRRTVEDFGLYSGLELTREQFAALQDAAKTMSAKMRAVRIVSASNVSRSELEHRLVQKGENPQKAREAVEWMEDLSFVDDERTAWQIVEQCIRKGYGSARAKQVLYEKRIPKELWDKVLSDYPDQMDSITDFLRARLKGAWDQRDLKRAVDALLRRGHSYGDVKRALDRLKVDHEEFQEE